MGGGGIPACTEADTPPVNRITDALPWPNFVAARNYSALLLSIFGYIDHLITMIISS